MPNATSLFNINADTGLNKWQMRFYMLANKLNNSFPNFNIDKNLEIKKFHVDNLEKYWPELEIKSSPSRALSDLFWLSLPWQKIKQELGEIHIFDAGCGSGNYGVFFIEKAEAPISSYTGIDTHQSANWKILKDKYPNFKFAKGDSSNIYHLIPEKINFFMSQSALEHFPKDLLYFERIKEFTEKKKQPVIQVHLFPSAACLDLYKYHGFRQYTPRTISKITRIFSNFSDSILYNLGGEQCNQLHYEFITKPKYELRIEDKRETNTKEYYQKLFKAIQTNNGKNPSFYALVIHSYPQCRLF
jgi:SAM-dependent methyltransferase